MILKYFHVLICHLYILFGLMPVTLTHLLIGFFKKMVELLESFLF